MLGMDEKKNDSSLEGADTSSAIQDSSDVEQCGVLGQNSHLPLIVGTFGNLSRWPAQACEDESVDEVSSWDGESL